MAEHDQNRVWANVRASTSKMADNLRPTEAAGVESTTSYAKVFASAPVEAAVAEYGGGRERVVWVLRELRSKDAVGVVIAVDGRVEWADVFASYRTLREILAEAHAQLRCRGYDVCENRRGTQPSATRNYIWITSAVVGRLWKQNPTSFDARISPVTAIASSSLHPCSQKMGSQYTSPK